MDFNSGLILLVFTVASGFMAFLGKKVWDIDKKMSTICAHLVGTEKDVRELRDDLEQVKVDFRLNGVKHGA